MKQKRHWLLPLIFALLPILIAWFFGAELLSWSQKLKGPLRISPLLLGALLLLALPIIPALLFNQIRLFLVALLSVAVLLMAEGSLVQVGPVSLALLPPLVAVLVVVLTYMRERGLLNRFGLIRLAVVVAPLLLLIVLDGPLAQLKSLLASKLPAVLSGPGRGSTTYISLLILAVAGGLLWRLRGTEFHAVAPCLFSVVLLTYLGLDGALPIWPKAAQGAARPLAMSFAGLSLLWCAYRLSWGRAYKDELTGLPGRRALEERLAGLAGTYAMAMADIDHFKRFNDEYGHECGDDALRLVASVFESHAPGTVYRYGGEEFTFIMTGQTPREFAESLDLVREKVAAEKLVPRKNKGEGKPEALHVTVSFGVSGPSAQHDTPHKVLGVADKALYEAKRLGRNRVVMIA